MPKINRQLTISLKIRAPELLKNEVKSIRISVYSHGHLCMPRQVGLKSSETIILQPDQNSCLVTLLIPAFERCYLHTSAFIDDPVPNHRAKSIAESRYLGYKVSPVEASGEDVAMDLTIGEFDLFSLYRKVSSF